MSDAVEVEVATQVFKLLPHFFPPQALEAKRPGNHDASHCATDSMNSKMLSAMMQSSSSPSVNWHAV